jgi:hypothetical protein
MLNTSRLLLMIVMIVTLVCMVQEVMAGKAQQSSGKGQLQSDKSVSTDKDGASKASDRLPLDRGWFLPEDNQSTCDELMEGPSAEREGILLCYDGKSLNSSAYEECTIRNVKNSGNIYDITLKCKTEGKMGNGESVDHMKITIKSRTSFSTDENGKSQTYTWRCGLPK